MKFLFQRQLYKPDQPTDTIGSFAAEQKQRIFIIWVKIELESYDSGKTIDTFPHIGAACGYVNFFDL